MLEELFEGIQTHFEFFPYISILPVFITFLHFIFKIANRTKIERILESKYQNKLYNLLEITFVSIIVPIVTAIYTFSIDIKLTHKTIEIAAVASSFIILFGACLFIIAYLSHQIIPNSIKKYLLRLLNKYRLIGKLYYRLSKEAIRTNILKGSLIIYFISLSILNFTFVYIYKVSETFNPEVILTIIVFSIIYLIAIYTFRYLFSKGSYYKKELFEMSVIENINDCLTDLSYLYAMDKKKFVFIDKQDAKKEKDSNSLTKFYLYFVEENQLLMFRVYEK